MIDRERIVTTLPKAKELRPILEKMVTLGKNDSVHARRMAGRSIQDKEILAKLFETIGPRFMDRPGGYTRIIKLGTRRGDGAEMAIIEFVDFEHTTKAEPEKAKTKAEKAKKKAEPAEIEEETEEGAEKKSATAARKPAAKKPAAKKPAAKKPAAKKPAAKKPAAKKPAAKKPATKKPAAKKSSSSSKKSAKKSS